jgi:hypothetical protein
MASEDDVMLIESSREAAQARQQLAWYQSQSRCWTPVGWTEGSGRQNGLSWQCQPREGHTEMGFRRYLGYNVRESKTVDHQQGRRYMKDQQAVRVK